MASSRVRVLLVDDDPGLLRTMQLLLEDEGGYAVEPVTSGAEALDRLNRGSGFQVLVTDLSMPGMDGLQLLREVKEQRPDLPVILMTAYGSVRSAVEAMRFGAFQYLTKPVDPDEFLLQIERALEFSRLAGSHRALKERLGDPERYDVLVGDSLLMTQLRQTITRVAQVDSTVLLRGETGTGKELVARLMHRQSGRSDQPFVTVNCTAIPGELIESELFGHEKGAFTGANAARPGRITEAEGGTLLLDEVGDMPLTLQPKLLRFLQERTVRRVGGATERVVDVRVIAATHRDLEAAMTAGDFRQDLFHRLNTIPVDLPPLRQHREDLPALADHLAAKIARRLGKPRPTIARDALDALMGYLYPGNVRELENLLERAIVLGPSLAAGGGTIHSTDLPLPALQQPAPSLGQIPLPNGLRLLAEISEDAERDLIRRALEAWPDLPNAEIAERLGTNRRVLELRIKQFGLVKGVPAK